LLHAGRCWHAWRRRRHAARRRRRQTRPAKLARAPPVRPGCACRSRPWTDSKAWRPAAAAVEGPRRRPPRPLQTCLRHRGAPRTSAWRARTARRTRQSRCEQRQAARRAARRQQPWLSAPGGQKMRTLRQARPPRRPRAAKPSRRSSRRSPQGRLRCRSLAQPRVRAAGRPHPPPGALSLTRQARLLTGLAVRRGPRRASRRSRSRMLSLQRALERPALIRARPASRPHHGARAGAGMRWRR